MFSSLTYTDSYLNQFFAAQLVIITLIAVIMNIIVVVRMKALYRRNPEQYYNGVGICLSVMAIADLVSLSALFVQFININVPVSFNESLQNFMCKFIAFFAHSAFTLSFFCLAIMSFLRYVATTKPLEYKILYRIPLFLILASVIFAVLLNSVLFIDVIYENGQCIQPLTTMSRGFKFADFLCSFCFPIMVVLYFDLNVLCCRIQSPFSDPMLQIVINRPNAEKRKSLKRFLVILFLAIVLNIPEHSLRIAGALGVPVLDIIPQPLLVLAKSMYFYQFAFKSFYLTLMVYNKSVLSKTNSSRQLSLSFRQKLEESTHMIHIRERASTMSYRASSPLPQRVQRSNSSYGGLNELLPGKYSF